MKKERKVNDKELERILRLSEALLSNDDFVINLFQKKVHQPEQMGKEIAKIATTLYDTCAAHWVED